MMQAELSPSAPLRAVRRAPPPGFLERLDEVASKQPDAVALEVEGDARRLSYAQLRVLVARYRGALQSRGVERGDFLVLALPPGTELVACFYALASLGAVAVPVSRGLRPFELSPILEDARPVGAVVADDCTFAGALEAQPGVRFVVRHAELDAYDARPLALDAPSPTQVVSCHFTYKGLGYPLGALHSYADYAACVDALADRFGGSRGKTHLVLLPVHPIYALVAGVLTPLALGARVVLVPRLGGRSVFDLLVQHRARLACLVPLLFAQLASQARKRGDARGLHPELELVSGGSLLTRDLAASVADATGVEPMQGYGLTETLPVITNYAARERRGTLGVPVRDDVRVAIVDAFGHEAPPGGVGEIVVSGPTVTCGYVGRPRETERFLRGGRFHTGDLGSIDDDGFVHFAGRALAFTKCASQMVDLTEVELLLRRHAKIADARVTVDVDRRIGERIRATVVLKRPSSMDRREVTSFCREHLSAHKVPREIDFCGRDGGAGSAP